MIWIYKKISLNKNKSSKFWFIVLQKELFILKIIKQIGVMSRDWYVIWYLDVYILASSNGNPTGLSHRYEMKYFGIFSTFLHDLHDNIGLVWTRDLHCVKLFIVHVNSVFVVSFTHLTSQWTPFDSHTILRFNNIQTFTKPHSQTSQMNISNWSRTLASTN